MSTLIGAIDKQAGIPHLGLGASSPAIPPETGNGLPACNPGKQPPGMKDAWSDLGPPSGRTGEAGCFEDLIGRQPP
jgi:hypothetical protein